MNKERLLTEYEYKQKFAVDMLDRESGVKKRRYKPTNITLPKKKRKK